MNARVFFRTARTDFNFSFAGDSRTLFGILGWTARTDLNFFRFATYTFLLEDDGAVDDYVWDVEGVEADV